MEITAVRRVDAWMPSTVVIHNNASWVSLCNGSQPVTPPCARVRTLHD